MDKTEIFIEKYKALEAAVGVTYEGEFEGSPVSFLERQRDFKDLSSGIKCCREVRNLLQHNVKINGKNAILPDDALLSFIDVVTDRVKNPALGIDYAISAEDVFSGRMNGNVRDTMRLMRKFGYTHVPILSDGKVRGVFSEHTAFEFFLRNYEDRIDGNTKFSDIYELIRIDRNHGERFVFKSVGTRLSEIIDIFEDGLNKNEKVKMVFLTKTGSQNERLEAIISHWDIIGLQ